MRKELFGFFAIGILIVMSTSLASAAIEDADEFLEIYQTYLADEQIKKGSDALSANDYEAAFEIFVALAEKGNPRGQLMVGSMYEFGWGVPKDYGKAVYWTKLAVEQHLPIAQFNLGTYYHNGNGVIKDYVEAARLFMLAAEQGHAQAQFNLATYYLNAWGLEKNPIRAYMWFNLALAQGVEEGALRLALLETQMTTQQVSEAQALSRSCLQNSYKEC